MSLKPRRQADRTATLKKSIYAHQSLDKYEEKETWWSPKVSELPETHEMFPGNVYRGQRISPEMVSAIRDLSGIANNVNQIAHQMHIYGLEAVKQQCFSIISEVSRIITQVKNNNHDSED